MLCAAQNVYTVAWRRKDGRQFPSRVVDDGQGRLTIHGVQQEDEGAYTCTGSDYYSVAVDEARVTVTRNGGGGHTNGGGEGGLSLL